MKKGVLKKFADLSGKHLKSLFNKVADLKGEKRDFNTVTFL